jgi:hypothetical protein
LAVDVERENSNDRNVHESDKEAGQRAQNFEQEKVFEAAAREFNADHDSDRERNRDDRDRNVKEDAKNGGLIVKENICERERRYM